MGEQKEPSTRNWETWILILVSLFHAVTSGNHCASWARFSHLWIGRLSGPSVPASLSYSRCLVTSFLPRNKVHWYFNLPTSVQFSSVAQSCPILQPHGMQHARHPCPSPTPGAYSNSCPLSQWCHPTISSSVIPFSSRLQPFPASRSFPMSQFFESGGQSIGISASTSVLPMNIQDWFPLRWTGWILLQSKGLSRVLSNTTVQKHSAVFIVPLSHPYMITGKTIALTKWTFVGKVMSLLFNMLSRLVIAFLPSSKHLLISWLQSPSAVILEPPKTKSLTVSIVSPSICHERCHDLSFLNVEF